MGFSGRLAVAVGVLACAGPAFGAGREVVEHAADIIENNYFDVSRAREIASGLRDDAQAGKFDAFKDPRDLADELTRRLKKVDRHFNLSWSPRVQAASSMNATGAVRQPPRSAGGEAQAPQPLPSDIADRRAGYGFRRVEMLPGAIGYIDLRYFVDFSFTKPDEPARAAADAALQLVSGADAVIIDLRYNGGGSPAMVGYLVSAFVPPNADVYNVFHRRDSTESERPGQLYAKPRPYVPLYVLISGRTASAAESTAYTLQAAHRATIVGSTSVGAANPGGEFPLDDGFNLFVSTGTPVNPLTGRNWEGVGVTPDVRADPERALEHAEILALETVLARNSSSAAALDTRWTLEALRAELAPPKGPPLAGYVGTYADATITKAGEGLALKRAGHGEMTLMRVRGDVFFVRGEPFRRVLFERNSAGTVTGFQLVRSSGQALWFPHHSVGTG